jgi:hypothetical protein
MLENSLRQIFLNDRFEHVQRCILFLYVVAVLCPVRYLEFNAKDVDNTWQLALIRGGYAQGLHFAVEVGALEADGGGGLRHVPAIFLEFA